MQGRRHRPVRTRDRRTAQLRYAAIMLVKGMNKRRTEPSGGSHTRQKALESREHCAQKRSAIQQLCRWSTERASVAAKHASGSFGS